jgi:hypothetical protein
MALVATGTITAANLRLATVANGAMLYANGLDLSPYAGGAYRITLVNTGTLEAYSGEAGAGAETLGVDALNGWNFTAGWATSSATIDDANSFTTAGIGSIYKNTTITTGSLYKGTFAGASTAGGVRLTDGLGSVAFATLAASPGYGTATHPSAMVRNLAAGTTDVTTLKLEILTAPPATGLFLRNAPALGGAKTPVSDTLAKNTNVTYNIYTLSSTPLPVNEILTIPRYRHKFRMGN